MDFTSAADRVERLAGATSSVATAVLRSYEFLAELTSRSYDWALGHHHECGRDSSSA
jgi:hypothetical protein